MLAFLGRIGSISTTSPGVTGQAMVHVSHMEKTNPENAQAGQKMRLSLRRKRKVPDMFLFSSRSCQFSKIILLSYCCLIVFLLHVLCPGSVAPKPVRAVWRLLCLFAELTPPRMNGVLFFKAPGVLWLLVQDRLKELILPRISQCSSQGSPALMSARESD